VPRNVAITERRRVLGRKEAAEALGCSVYVIDQMVEDGRLKTVKIGETPKITIASIDKLLGA
jgi:excisionase family DNA binding protein